MAFVFGSVAVFIAYFISRMSRGNSVLSMVLAGMVVALLMGYVKLTQISGNISDMKQEMNRLNTEHVGLLTEYEQTFELATVKEVAEAAGMSKPSAGQIEYVELSGPDTAVIYAAGEDGALTKAFASAKEGILALVEYFS